MESSSGLGDDELHMCRLELKVDLNFNVMEMDLVPGFPSY